MKKIYCIISAFSKEPVLEVDYNKLYETAIAQDCELEFITIAPEGINVVNSIGKVMSFNKNYTHNQAMSEVIPTIPDGMDGMLVLDTKYASDYPLIKNMFLELKHGANIVHVKRKRNNYWDKVFEYSLKFFNVINQMITGSNDNNYVRTLHLVDKSVLILLKYFPNKYGIFCEADFLANCKVATLFIDAKYELAKQRKKNIIKPLIGIFFMIAGVASFVLAVTLTLGLNFIFWMLIACITFIIGGGTYLCYAIIEDKIKTTPKKVKETKVTKNDIDLIMEENNQSSETVEDIETQQISKVESQIEESNEMVEETIETTEVVEEIEPPK